MTVTFGLVVWTLVVDVAIFVAGAVVWEVYGAAVKKRLGF